MLSSDSQKKRPRPLHLFMVSIGLTLAGVAFWTFLLMKDKAVNTRAYQNLVFRFFYNEMIPIFYSSKACGNTLAGKVLTSGSEYVFNDIKDVNNNTLYTTGVPYRHSFKIKSLRFSVINIENDWGKGVITVVFEPDTKNKVMHQLEIAHEIPLQLHRDLNNNNVLSDCLTVDNVNNLNKDYLEPLPPHLTMQPNFDVQPPVQTNVNLPRWIPGIIWPESAMPPTRTQQFVTQNIFYNYRNGQMKKTQLDSASLVELDDGREWAGVSKVIFNKRGEVGYDGDRATLVLSAYTRIQGISFDTTLGNDTFERMRINAEGRVGIGVEHPDSMLTVAGSISTPPVSTSYSTIDASLSNIFRLRSPASSSIQLYNMADGGEYKVIIENPQSQTYDFPACNGTSYWSPEKGATKKDTHTIYKILALKNEKRFDCYIHWQTGFK